MVPRAVHILSNTNADIQYIKSCSRHVGWFLVYMLTCVAKFSVTQLHKTILCHCQCMNVTYCMYIRIMCVMHMYACKCVCTYAWYI